MEQSDMRQALKEYLLGNIQGAKLVSGGREVLARCHMCMDSPDRSKAHLYMSLGDENKPPMYNCFLCQEGGVIDGKYLRSLNIYDPNLISSVNSEIDRISKKAGNQIYKNSSVSLNHYCNYNYSELSQYKLAYINGRLGQFLTYKDLNDLKIILNIEDLMRVNNITKYTRYPNVMEQINYNFIGFISADNCFINMRNLYLGEEVDSIHGRYINYNIFGKIDNSSRYYIMPAQIDLTNPNPVEIHIAEGPFDILSIALNVRQNFNHNIYMSIGGKSYLNAIKYFVEKLGLINMIINIYIDNDIDQYDIINIINYLTPFNINFRVFRNMYTGEKDFGVPKDKIKVAQIY